MTASTTAALLVVDLQKALDHPSWSSVGPRNNPGAERDARRLLDAWRASGRPVIHIRHDSTDSGSTYRPGQPGHAFKDEVVPLDGETVVAKQVNSAFVGTDLAARLAGLSCTELFVCGAITNNAVEATVRMAGNLGYRTWLVADACFTFARRDWSGRSRSADEVHDMSLANLDGEYCRVVAVADALAAVNVGDQPMPLSDALWTASADQAERILVHPFVRGLGDGTLGLPSFKGYVAQDAYFLEAFARAYAFCLANSASREDLYGFAALIQGVLAELKLHGAYAERWNVDLAGVVPGAATRAYTEFLLETARTGDLGETIAAMTPCMRLYAFLGQSLAKGRVAAPYADWVATYADPGFEALAAGLEKLLDRHATDTPAVRANYRRAMDLECGFFDACL